jgi:phosphoserine phosphatase RsbU/P
MSEFLHKPSVHQELESLTRELSLRRLQIQGLLHISQAIQNNIKVEDLFLKYRDFLGWEMGIDRVALFLKKENDWEAVTWLGVDADHLNSLKKFIPQIFKPESLSERDEPEFKPFSLVIPSFHKEDPVAYVFIGWDNLVSTEDEMMIKINFITTLTNIVAVAIENKRLFKRQLEQEKLRHEVELASEVQRSLIPNELPYNHNYEFASIYKPSMGVGGDYFDYLELPDGRYVFCIADITGKGLAAAMLMSNFQATLYNIIKSQPLGPDLMEELNRLINRITKGDRYLTLFIGEFTPGNRRFKYINAGHIPPILAQEAGITRLETGCTILGFFTELPKVSMGEITLEDHAILTMFTDGLLEVNTIHNHLIDESMLEDWAKQDLKHSALVFNKRLESIFPETTEQLPDDITVLTWKLFPEQNS